MSRYTRVYIVSFGDHCAKGNRDTIYCEAAKMYLREYSCWQ